ncbi:hypothetical protein ALC60_10683 [Trachymyrmex zeteki]|uniref:Uncharacterized protein n=1 Tax=Mycetomoellerius zeteki TaxID=64791 RepID=A0A151WQQ4_9HYME|nr:hypothetical protein ALC60_10683 [Trachymyrmex zeteki]
MRGERSGCLVVAAAPRAFHPRAASGIGSMPDHVAKRAKNASRNGGTTRGRNGRDEKLVEKKKLARFGVYSIRLQARVEELLRVEDDFSGGAVSQRRAQTVPWTPTAATSGRFTYSQVRKYGRCAVKKHRIGILGSPNYAWGVMRNL